MILFINTIILFLLLFLNSASAEVSYKIDEKTAWHLVALAHDGNIKYIQSYDYDGDDSKLSPPFFTYDGLGPVNGSFGFFAVNPWTGDVWNLWGCRKESTPASRKIHARIKKRFTVSEMKQYKRLSDIKPFCTFDWDDPDYK